MTLYRNTMRRQIVHAIHIQKRLRNIIQNALEIGNTPRLFPLGVESGTRSARLGHPPIHPPPEAWSRTRRRGSPLLSRTLYPPTRLERCLHHRLIGPKRPRGTVSGKRYAHPKGSNKGPGWISLGMSASFLRERPLCGSLTC